MVWHLKKHRNKGYGEIVLDKTIKLAKDRECLEFRIYTDEYAVVAHQLYKKRGLMEEEYNNPDNKDNYIDTKIYIYSLGLCNE